MDELKKAFLLINNLPGVALPEQQFADAVKDPQNGAIATLKDISDAIAGRNLEQTIFATHPPFCSKTINSYFVSLIKIGYLFAGKRQYHKTFSVPIPMSRTRVLQQISESTCAAIYS